MLVLDINVFLEALNIDHIKDFKLYLNRNSVESSFVFDPDNGIIEVDIVVMEVLVFVDSKNYEKRISVYPVTNLFYVGSKVNVDNIVLVERNDMVIKKMVLDDVEENRGIVNSVAWKRSVTISLVIKKVKELFTLTVSIVYDLNVVNINVLLEVISHPIIEGNHIELLLDEVFEGETMVFYQGFYRENFVFN